VEDAVPDGIPIVRESATSDCHLSRVMKFDSIHFIFICVEVIDHSTIFRLPSRFAAK